MNILGLTVTRQKAAPESLYPVSDRGGWWPMIRESFTGAWQKNVEVKFDCVIAHHAVFACVTLIASDIAKLRVKLVEQDDNGIWSETTNAAYSPVLRKPNRYQTRIQFWETWVLSKLMRGNTYVLKQRDARKVVVALYVLDPCRVKPLVASDGSVYYRLSRDDLAGQREDDIVVPASEIIHDRMNCLFHPLVGISPIFACGIAATQGLSIQNNQTRFFNNRSMPGGILTAPGAIGDETAKRLKEAWEANYSGENTGRVAVLGDGLKFEGIAMTAAESQLIDQLKWTAETVCSTFHVPGYKVGVGALPSNPNVQSMNIEYYSQCLQVHIESAEECLDDGLGIGWADKIGTEFDTDNLLRMDTLSMVSAERDAVGAGIKSPNEARKKFDLKPTPGGEGPYLQQQNFSLAALAKRDAQADPFGSSAPKQLPADQPAVDAVTAPKEITIEFVKSQFTGRYELSKAA